MIKLVRCFVPLASHDVVPFGYDGGVPGPVPPELEGLQVSVTSLLEAAATERLPLTGPTLHEIPLAAEAGRPGETEATRVRPAQDCNRLLAAHNRLGNPGLWSVQGALRSGNAPHDE